MKTGQPPCEQFLTVPGQYVLQCNKAPIFKYNIHNGSKLHVGHKTCDEGFSVYIRDIECSFPLHTQIEK